MLSKLNESINKNTQALLSTQGGGDDDSEVSIAPATPTEVFDMETAIKKAGKWECDNLRCRECDAEQNVECLQTYGILTDDLSPEELHADDADEEEPESSVEEKLKPPKKLPVVQTRIVRTRAKPPAPKQPKVKKEKPPATKEAKVKTEKGAVAELPRKKNGELKRLSKKLLLALTRPQLMKTATEVGVKGSNRLSADVLREAITKAQK